MQHFDEIYLRNESVERAVIAGGFSMNDIREVFVRSIEQRVSWINSYSIVGDGRWGVYVRTFFPRHMSQIDVGRLGKFMALFPPFLTHSLSYAVEVVGS